MEQKPKDPLENTGPTNLGHSRTSISSAIQFDPLCFPNGFTADFIAFFGLRSRSLIQRPQHLVLEVDLLAVPPFFSPEDGLTFDRDALMMII